MSDQSSKQQGYALLADMRRKYLHAKARGWETDGEFIKGNPITATILERWIPEVEALVAGLPDETPADARPVCPHCGLINGFHQSWCSRLPATGDINGPR